jgi:hypothetical protein
VSADDNIGRVLRHESSHDADVAPSGVEQHRARPVGKLIGHPCIRGRTGILELAPDSLGMRGTRDDRIYKSRPPMWAPVEYWAGCAG